MKTMKPFNGRKQRGYGLLEIMLGIAIVGILVGLVVKAFGGINESTKVEQAFKNQVALTTAVVNAYRSQGDYVGLINAAMTKSPALPADMKVPANLAQIKHPWRTDGVTLAPTTITSANDAFTMTWVDVPEGACISIAQQTYRLYQGMSINGTAITSVSNVAPSCNGASNTLVWTVR